MKISESHKTLTLNAKNGTTVICLSKIRLVEQIQDKLSFYFDDNHVFISTFDNEKECKEALSGVIRNLNS